MVIAPRVTARCPTQNQIFSFPSLQEGKVSLMSEGFVKFRLEGEVTIGKLSDACIRFTRVLRALDESHDASVRWVLAGLDHGSAVVTARAMPLDEEAEELIPAMCEEVLHAASWVASMQVEESHTLLDRPLLDRVRELAEVVDENNQITLEAAGAQVTFTPSIRVAIAERQVKTTSSLGTVRGRVATLSHRKGLRFFLYELATDKSVRCHPDPSLEDRMRSVWNRVAEVTGTITRDAITGQPISIRDITAVNTIEEGEPMGYLQARGALRIGESAEQAVRRARDASR